MPGRGRDGAPFLAEINALYCEHRGWKQGAGTGPDAVDDLFVARLAAALVRPADPGNAGPCAPGFGLDGCARTVKKRPWTFPTIRAPF